MKAIIAADELAKDVAGAEALLERHQEHRVWFILFVSKVAELSSLFYNYLNRAKLMQGKIASELQLTLARS